MHTPQIANSNWSWERKFINLKHIRKTQQIHSIHINALLVLIVYIKIIVLYKESYSYAMLVILQNRL